MVKLARTLNPKIKKPSEIKDVKFSRPKKKDGTVLDHFVLNTRNSLDRPVNYIDNTGKIINDPVTAGAESILYGGCYARIKVQVNPDMASGKVKLWCNLVAIQFVAHGERLGAGAMSDEELSDGFGEVEVEDDFDKAGNDEGDDFDDDLDDELDSSDDEFDEDDFDLDD